jgi:hypothetical protein
MASIGPPPTASHAANTRMGLILFDLLIVEYFMERNKILACRLPEGRYFKRYLSTDLFLEFKYFEMFIA